jgi:hypothetical protein
VTGSVKDPCDEGRHRIVRDENGYKVCDRCDLTLQGVIDWVGHDVTDEEYHLE